MSTNERGPSLADSLGLSYRCKRLLSCLGCSGQKRIKYVFPHRTLINFMCLHRPAAWAGSRAGPPVSKCVSPGNPLPITQRKEERGRMVVFLAVLAGGAGGRAGWSEPLPTKGS